LFLHIGLHKTGTTYLQNTLRVNAAELQAEGVHYPADGARPVQVLAVADFMGRRPQGATDNRITGAWQGVVDTVSSSDAPTALLSDEHLSLASPKQARRAVRAFPDREVHVIVTARDLGRVLVSAWQEEVKNRGAWTWAEFSSAVQDPGAASRSPARGFWLRQDLPAILATWQSGVPRERIHVVTVPPAGTSSSALLARLGSLVGFDARRLTHEAPWANETIGLAGTEVVRRLNERLGDSLNQRQYDRTVKLTIVRILAELTEPVRFALPPEDLDWARERGQQMIDAVREAAYPVVGDLDELVPRPASGRRPDEPSEGELTDAALAALAGLAERYAKVWWARRDPDDEANPEARWVRVSSNARAVVYRGQRVAARYADRSAVAGRVLDGYLRLRAVSRDRAAGRHRAAP
jgi:hypothetical protein